jgi:hypothetical protein
VPSYNALGTALRKLDLDKVSDLFAQWEQAQQGSLQRSLAFDGKDLGKGLGQLISLVLSDCDEAGIPIAQRTADALHCQHKQLQAIATRGGEFIISLKDNQKARRQDSRRQILAATLQANDARCLFSSSPLPIPRKTTSRWKSSRTSSRNAASFPW